MESRGHGRRGRSRGSSRPLPGFDQQAFVEAMGAAFTSIAQASATSSQGGSSDLKRFIAHHPPSFRGGGDPMVADHWFRQVERVLEAMRITSDATRIRLATFKLEGESKICWDWAKVSRDLETMTWGDFRELFMTSFSQHLRGMQRPGSSLS